MIANLNKVRKGYITLLSSEDYLKAVLLELNNYDITGVMYYDISIVNLKEKLNLKYDLVWSQEHLTTNYFTCNYWYSKSIKRRRI